MDILTPALIGIGLAMDCFAVSLALGTKTKTRFFETAAVIALSFGLFQAIMALIGWAAGMSVTGLVSTYGPIIAFSLLAIIGGKMLWEGVKGDEDAAADINRIRILPVIILSFATSIDALAVGVSFGLLRSEILLPALIIGLVSVVFSFGGVLSGRRLFDTLGSRAEILGGIILILIGINILLGHPLW